MQQVYYYHLLKRAGFGPDLKHMMRVPSTRTATVENIFTHHSGYEALTIDYPKYTKEQIRQFKPEERKAFQKLNRQKITEFNIAWLKRMAESTNFFRERMVYFWSNHFVVLGRNIRFTESYNNTLRTHALGNFKDLCIAVSQEANMLNYLDNNKNKKQAPNENYARELMELFTLGQDVIYTESDVKEAARALTGWRNTPEGKFIEVKKHHDFGQKHFLGQKGNFDGEDIITIILEQKECARFICQKIYRHFINETINPPFLEAMVEVFYPNYNIAELMKFLFLSDWFYDPVNIACQIKSPLEVLTSIYKVAPFTIDKPKKLIAIQKIMGQVLLQPPNVAGWPGGKSWIDSNTLMFRLRLPSLLFNGGMIDSELPMEENQMHLKKKQQFFKAKVDWGALKKLEEKVDETSLQYALFGTLLNKELFQYTQDDDWNTHLLKLMSLPEFQMC